MHAAVAIVVHRMPPADAQPEKPTPAEIVRIVLPSPPPPTPTPPPIVQPHHAASQHPAHNTPNHVAVSVPHLSSHGGGNTHPADLGTPGPLQTGEPGPTGPPATPAPACSEPYVSAHTIDAISPSAPEDAAGMEGTAEIQVSLDAAGRVTDVRVYHSTGSMGLDRAALDAARRSTYAPQIVDCQPAGGTYLFRVDFQN